MTEEMERGLDDVCNLSEAIEEQGIKKGIQQGIEQGIAKGRTELIRNALKNGLPEDVILKVLGVSEDDIRRAKL
jgi:predicted transposase/invertase (TIGR01784 family)